MQAVEVDPDAADPTGERGGGRGRESRSGHQWRGREVVTPSPAGSLPICDER